MSKGGGKQTTTQTSEPPPYVSQAQQNLLSTAQNFTAPFVSNPPQNTVAGFTPDQQLAFDLARGMADNTFNSNPQQVNLPNVLNLFNSGTQSSPTTMSYTYHPALARDPGWAPTSLIESASQMGPIALANAAQGGGLERVDASVLGTAGQYDVNQGQVNGDQIRSLLNPYIGDVIDPTVARMRQQLGQTQAQIGAQGASSAAFGGSRAALQQSEAARNFGDQVAQTVGTLMSQGYDRATATALANAQQRQQGGEFNTAAQNAVNEADVARQQQTRDFNASAYNALLEANAARRQQVELANQQQQNAYRNIDVQRDEDAKLANMNASNNMMQYNVNNDVSTNRYNIDAQNAANVYESNARNASLLNAQNLANADANRQLQAYGMQNTLSNDEATRQRAALAQLLGIGSTEQQTAQASLNTPLDMLKLLMGATPNTYGQTATTQQPTQSNIGSTLGGIASIASLFFSDPKDKTDITKLGTDSESGLPMYAYRYKDDPKNTPKAVGPMATDIEKMYPGAVTEVGGHKVVRGDILAAMLGAKRRD
jgi:hypothetical protein